MISHDVHVYKNTYMYTKIPIWKIKITSKVPNICSQWQRPPPKQAPKRSVPLGHWRKL